MFVLLFFCKERKATSTYLTFLTLTIKSFLIYVGETKRALINVQISVHVHYIIFYSYKIIALKIRLVRTLFIFEKSEVLILCIYS